MTNSGKDSVGGILFNTASGKFFGQVSGAKKAFVIEDSLANIRAGFLDSIRRRPDSVTVRLNYIQNTTSLQPANYNVYSGRMQVAYFTGGTSAGGTSAIIWQNTSAASRWVLGQVGTESGSNTGSDLYLTSMSDAGSGLNTNVLFMQRSTGYVGLRNSSPVNTLDVNGSFGIAQATLATSQTLGDYQDVFVNNTTNITFTLPTVARRRYVFKKISNNTNTITLVPSSGTIETAANYTFSTYLGVRIAICDGTNWWIE